MKSLITGKIAPEFIKDETLPLLLTPTFNQYKDKTAFIFGAENSPITN
jgi:hypothetical protein